MLASHTENMKFSGDFLYCNHIIIQTSFFETIYNILYISYLHQFKLKGNVRATCACMQHKKEQKKPRLSGPLGFEGAIQLSRIDAMVFTSSNGLATSYSIDVSDADSSAYISAITFAK